MASSIPVKVQFSGGLQHLFNHESPHPLKLELAVPALVPVDGSSSLNAADLKTKPADISFLIHYIRNHHLKERAELFMENGTIRPGILVLINDTDWELEGESDYILRPKDEIVFISTLHGG